MLLYTLKRLLMMAPIILIVAFLVFTIMNLTPGNPARIILGPSASPEAIDKLNTELGYDRPFFVRFGHYVFDVVTRFDFGNAYRTREPVVDELVKRVPVSLRVAFNGILFATLVGIPIGIVSAVKQYSAIDSVARVLGILLASIPAFWLGLMLIMLFSLKLGLLPSSGLADWKSFVLPMMPWAFLPLARNCALPARPCWRPSGKTMCAPPGPRVYPSTRSSSAMP